MALFRVSSLIKIISKYHSAGNLCRYVDNMHENLNFFCSKLLRLFIKIKAEILNIWMFWLSDDLPHNFNSQLYHFQLFIGLGELGREITPKFYHQPLDYLLINKILVFASLFKSLYEMSLTVKIFNMNY